MIIRATQKNRISGAVTSVSAGIERREVAACCVGPAERGERHKPGREPGVEHVLVLAHRAAAVGAARRGRRGSRWCCRSRTSSQYHTGMRWPHQSWREMLQSRMSFEPVDVVVAPALGHERGACRRATPASAGAASGSIRTNHWSESRGSTTVSQR